MSTQIQRNKERGWSNGAESIQIDIPISYLKTIRSLIDRFSRDANVFSDFRFQGKIDNFRNNFYEEFMQDSHL